MAKKPICISSTSSNIPLYNTANLLKFFVVFTFGHINSPLRRFLPHLQLQIGISKGSIKGYKLVQIFDFIWKEWYPRTPLQSRTVRLMSDCLNSSTQNSKIMNQTNGSIYCLGTTNRWKN